MSIWIVRTMAAPFPHGLAAQQEARDTVLVVGAPLELATATEWGLFALVALAAANVIVLSVLSWRVHGLARQLTGLALRVGDRSGPVLERAAAIAANLEGITRSVRGDVKRLTGSARAVSDRLKQASAHMEARVEEFNALLEVVQSEAEEMFLDTASTVRGLRVGARALERGSRMKGGASETEVRLPSARSAEGESSRAARARGPRSGAKSLAEGVRRDGGRDRSSAPGVRAGR